MSWFPESCARFREERLMEAAQTDAEYLVAVCHYCGQTFSEEEERFDFNVTNYVNLVAGAMGIHREDKFKRYTLLRDLEGIPKEAEENIRESPFERDRIVEVLRAVFIR